MAYGISLDVGTSGLRTHAIDLSNNKILSTAITVRHPVPGSNVMDHLTFCIEVDQNLAHKLIIDAANRLISMLEIDTSKVERVGVCGNPIQLSIFQNIETRDLAFVGEHALKARGVELQKRDAAIIPADSLGLNINPKAEVMIPPAIKHEIGADALAMMYKTGLLEKRENCLVTDYGTNAEMALKVGDQIYTGSAAAGPAMEGQAIKFGMLASPGAISDLEYDFDWRCKVLDETMLPKDGDMVNLSVGSVIDEGPMHGKAIGVTGTGVIAAIAAGIESKMVKMPKIKTVDGKLHLQDGIYIENHDVEEAGKAFGAMRAGHFTLLEKAGIRFDDLDSMYMSGASGTYVDAIKAQKVGLLPPAVDKIYQVGNTSLALATDLVKDPGLMDKLQETAKAIRANHIMFATDKVFEFLYIQELAYWTEGMPIEAYNAMLATRDIQPLPTNWKKPQVFKLVERDIPVLGDKGLKVLRDIGVQIAGSFKGCTGCEACKNECPERAIQVEERNGQYFMNISSDLCSGTACLRCERICPQKVLKFKELEKELVSSKA